MPIPKCMSSFLMNTVIKSPDSFAKYKKNLHDLFPLLICSWLLLLACAVTFLGFLNSAWTEFKIRSLLAWGWSQRNSFVFTKQSGFILPLKIKYSESSTKSRFVLVLFCFFCYSITQTIWLEIKICCSNNRETKK